MAKFLFDKFCGVAIMYYFCRSKNDILNMYRNILVFVFAFTVAIGNVGSAVAHVSGIEALEQVENGGVNIIVSKSTLIVTGAEGQVLEVVSLTGRKVATFKIDSQSQRVELNIPRGCYILKVGRVVRKVSIR